MDNVADFLKSTPGVESDHPRIRELAGNITEGAQDPHQAARQLFLWVRDTIKYGVNQPFFLPEHFRATRIIERGQGFCVQKAVVLAALARASTIPARLVFADIINHMAPTWAQDLMGTNLFVYHCYTEMHLGGRWVQATPAFNRVLSDTHGFPLVEFDGKNDAIFPPTNQSGGPFVEYVKSHGSFADVPLEPMLEAWVECYGEERVEFWKVAFLQEAP